jgi:hypothetical protein
MNKKSEKNASLEQKSQNERVEEQVFCTGCNGGKVTFRTSREDGNVTVIVNNYVYANGGMAQDNIKEYVGIEEYLAVRQPAFTEKQVELVEVLFPLFGTAKDVEDFLQGLSRCNSKAALFSYLVSTAELNTKFRCMPGFRKTETLKGYLLFCNEEVCRNVEHRKSAEKSA